MGSTVTSRSIKLAGDNMDFAISEYNKDKYQLIIGDRTAEAIRLNLGSAIEVENESDMIVKGRDMTTGLPKTVTIHTNEIYHCLKKCSIRLEKKPDSYSKRLYQNSQEILSNAA